jgi:hypothetical protein
VSHQFHGGAQANSATTIVPAHRTHAQTRKPVDGEADGLPQPSDCYLIMSAPILQISASWSPVPPLQPIAPMSLPP